jgi:hypothetical protein
VIETNDSFYLNYFEIYFIPSKVGIRDTFYYNFKKTKSQVDLIGNHSVVNDISR